MDILYWTVVITMFIIGFIGLIYPIIPSVLFIFAGFILYGFFYSFEPFHWLFWTIQILFVLLLFMADYVANMIGVKKYGGSKAGIWGSTIGLLVGPFVIPAFGIIIGPFIGAILAELLVHKRDLWTASKIGFGSVIGFISSVLTKSIIQIVMVGYFFFVIYK
ncbi:DUF456 domain-containing protein [Peribacillus asahii]|uniref:DUF456 domain-containing protein n=1 Tax=Peribacillus asahii TaxID=228899 RepID=UPI002079B4D0|nr:DUF456 domain-containing protein [Peribacillus asahii]USK58815.1 DUF456 domain-containing protein [Peribacillus asahii]